MTRNSLRRSIALLPLLVPLSYGCVPLHSGGGGGGGANDGAGGGGSGGAGGASTVGTCGGTHWVGLSAACTSIDLPDGTWTASPLFAATAAGKPSSALPPYCTYTWTGEGAPSQKDITVLQQSAKDVDEDCIVVLPQTGGASSAHEEYEEYKDTLAHDLRRELVAQTRPASMALGGPCPVTAGPGVDVILIDTAPDALPGEPIAKGNDPHGYTLAHAIDDLGHFGHEHCSTGVATGSWLGLPWKSASTKSLHGGHAGRRSEVAKAVNDALTWWQANNTGQKLILNLSIGWENTDVADCDAVPTTFSTPTRAVYDALQEAACAGALVIAAAGNDPGEGPNMRPHGLICPGMWEALPTTCTGPIPVPVPMLTAAGGVDYADQPIVLTRLEGRPRIAATSLGGVGWAHGDVPPPPITGTSVSAAVMSAVSAVTWAANTGLQANDIVGQVYDAALPLLTHASPAQPEQADVCPFGATSCGIRRISLCSAFHAGCEPAPPRSTTTISGGVATPTGSPPLHHVSSFFTSGVFPDNPPVMDLSTTNSATLPRFQDPSCALLGGVFPQPTLPVCPDCTYSEGIFYGVLDPTVITGPTLVLQTTSSAEVQAAQLASTTPASSASPASQSVVGSSGTVPTGVTAAYITGTFIDSGTTVSVTEQILVLP